MYFYQSEQYNDVTSSTTHEECKTCILLRVLQEVADVVKESSLVVRADSCEAAQELATPLHWGRQSLLNGGQRMQDTL